MRRVLFAQTTESAGNPTQLRRLREAIAGRVSIATLAERHGRDRATAIRQLKVHAVVMCLNGENQSRADTLTVEERASLPDTVEILVAISRPMADDDLPDDLKNCRRFDLSSADSVDALACRIVHGAIAPVDPDAKHESTFERLGALVRVAAGLVATAIGNLEATRDFLVEQLGRYAVLVHYAVALLILALILSGVVALIVPLIGPVFRLLHKTVPVSFPPWWRRSAIAAATVVTLGFAVVAFPKPIGIDAIASEHTREWSRRLTDSLMNEGGFREHPTRGRAQGWLTAQVLTALLMASPTSLDDGRYQRAYWFLDRTRIVDATLRVDRTNELATVLAPYFKFTYDPSRLPDKYPSIGFAYDMFAIMNGQHELPQRAVVALDSRRADFLQANEPSKGWGYFGQFEWGVTEIAAWVGVALTQSLRVPAETISLKTDEREHTIASLRHIAAHLLSRQLPSSGAFSPIANLSRPEFARTYSTIMAIWALSEISDPALGVLDGHLDLKSDVDEAVRKAIRWLGETAEADGWKVNPNNPSGERPFLGLTSQTLCILNRVRVKPDLESEKRIAAVRHAVIADSKKWIKRELGDNDRTHDSDRYLFPTTLVIENSTFLWYPWTLALMNVLDGTSGKERDPDLMRAGALRDQLRARIGTYAHSVESAYNYVTAEALIGLHWKGTSSTMPVTSTTLVH